MEPRLLSRSGMMAEIMVVTHNRLIRYKMLTECRWLPLGIVRSCIPIKKNITPSPSGRVIDLTNGPPKDRQSWNLKRSHLQVWIHLALEGALNQIEMHSLPMPQHTDDLVPLVKTGWCLVFFWLVSFEVMQSSEPDLLWAVVELLLALSRAWLWQKKGGLTPEIQGTFLSYFL